MVAAVLDSVTALSKFLKCSRRQDATNTPQSKKYASGHGARKKHASKFDDFDDAALSTDVGVSEAITGEGSTDGSETDSPIMSSIPNKAMNRNKMPAANLSKNTPPGLMPPPGLAAPPGLEEARQAPPWQKGGYDAKRLNSQAKAFVPGASTYAPKADAHQLRESIHHLKASLEEWENDQPVYEAPVESSGINALRDAISKLTPQDAAMVQSLLRAKEAEQTASRGDWRSRENRGYEAGAKPRPFTPYHPREHPLSRGDPRVAKPQSVRPWKPESTLDDNDTLKANLRDLAAMDQTKVLMVRKINRLGLDSKPALEAYFSKFGPIERLMVSHTRSKASLGGACRVRPATVGFVVMSEASAAQAALAAGEEHVINGIGVCVSTFQSHPIDEQ